MRVIIFDTETTGLPKTRTINQDTLDLWPLIVQFSYIIYDTSTNEILKSYDEIVKLEEGIQIPEESIQIHGITNEISREKGKMVKDVLNDFFHDLQSVDLLVGHNVSFDINMLKVELLRIISETETETETELKPEEKYLDFLTNYKNIYCTMQESIELCDIKKTNKFGRVVLKWPKLSELHQKLFDSIPNNLHNSYNDILVTLRCFEKIKHNIDLQKDSENFKSISKLIGLY